jgi:GrpB-like predicted nucleotidyltransferase (UPF0157 family)
MNVTIVPHNTEWRHQFEGEASSLKHALWDNALTIHHIGSTSIPHILAKPIIDILIEVQSLIEVDKANNAMIDIGYEVMGEFGIKSRRYFRKNNPQGTRTYHIHVFETGSPDLVRHLAFRDYLRTHPEIAQQYSSLKAKLVSKADTDQDAYINGKDPFIKEWEARAVDWYKTSI